MNMGCWESSADGRWAHYLVELFGIVASDQKQDIRADILRHGIVVAHNLAVVHQKFRIGHEFCDAQHSRRCLRNKSTQSQMKREREKKEIGLNRIAANARYSQFTVRKSRNNTRVRNSGLFMS